MTFQVIKFVKGTTLIKSSNENIPIKNITNALKNAMSDFTKTSKFIQNYEKISLKYEQSLSKLKKSFFNLQ